MVTDRSGITIVEVIIAILIVTVGLLAAASTMAAATRMLNRGEMSVTAASHAQDRFESVRALTCPNQASGTDTRGPYTITWTVAQSPVGNSNRVFLTTSYGFGRTTRVDSFETAIGCV